MNHHLSALFPELVVHIPAALPAHTLQSTLLCEPPLTGAEAAALHTVALSAQSVVARLTHDVVLAPELPTLLWPLRLALAGACECFGDAFTSLTVANNAATSAAASAWLMPQLSAQELHDYTICDEYFRFVRVRDMTQRQLAAQIAITSLGIIDDLPYMLLNLDEMTALLNAVAILFGAVWKGLAPLAHQVHEARDEDAATGAAIPAGSHWPAPDAATAGAAPRDVRIAYRRLIAGHHFWNLTTLFCADTFLHGEAAFARGDDEAGAHLLRQAAMLIRAGTAAMWFASIFPMSLYQSALRPTMAETETRDGSTQHLTYTMEKIALTRLREALTARFGANKAQWPDLVYMAMKDFYEMFMQDMEQHILIASSKVGMDASLAQKVWQSEMPSTLRLKNAMDLLRDMAAMRAREWKM